MNFNKEYFNTVLADILKIDSPTGFCQGVIASIKGIVEGMGYDAYTTHKGNLVVNVKGAKPRTVGISAHVDTLGLMVKSIKEDGTLAFVKVGGATLPTLDGEYCKIYTRTGEVYTGTILSNSPASHVYADASDLKRDAKNMHVRLDATCLGEHDTPKYPTKATVKSLGIRPGDFICYEPKTEILDNGFIKSRFLDDKAGVALVLAILKQLKDEGAVLANNLCVVFSTYEEIGHGLSHLPKDVEEFVAIDMGCIGDDLDGSEFAVSICASDSSGPYNYELTSRLIHLAEKNGINHAVDIYPYYGSDVSAARRAGHDFKGALFGPGIAASHGMERTHISAIENSYKLLYLYLMT